MKKLLAAILLALCPSAAFSLTLSEIKTEIRLAVRDNPTNTTFRRYSNATIENYINEAQREIVNLTGLAIKTSSYILTRGVTYYSLPADLTNVEQVYFAGTGNNTSVLQAQSQRSLFEKNPAWERNSGSPSYYWVSNSTNPNQTTTPLKISYIPIPTASSTGTVTIWYYSIVEDLSADTHVPFDKRLNLYPFHMALAYQVITRIKLREGKLEEATSYNNFYLNSVSIMKQRLGEMPDYNPGIGIPGVNR